MHGVGSTLDHHIGDASPATAVFRGKCAHLKLEFGNGIHGGNPLGNIDATVYVYGIGRSVHENIRGCNRGPIGGKENIRDGVVGASVFAVAIVNNPWGKREHE